MLWRFSDAHCIVDSLLRSLSFKVRPPYERRFVRYSLLDINHILYKRRYLPCQINIYKFCSGFEQHTLNYHKNSTIMLEGPNWKYFYSQYVLRHQSYEICCRKLLEYIIELGWSETRSARTSLKADLNNGSPMYLISVPVCVKGLGRWNLTVGPKSPHCLSTARKLRIIMSCI